MYIIEIQRGMKNQQVCVSKLENLDKMDTFYRDHLSKIRREIGRKDKKETQLEMGKDKWFTDGRMGDMTGPHTAHWRQKQGAAC